MGSKMFKKLISFMSAILLLFGLFCFAPASASLSSPYAYPTPIFRSSFSASNPLGGFDFAPSASGAEDWRQPKLTYEATQKPYAECTDAGKVSTNDNASNETSLRYFFPSTIDITTGSYLFETKFRTDTAGNVRKLFNLVDGGHSLYDNALVTFDSLSIKVNNASSTVGTYNKDQWYHILALVSGGVCKVYIDGANIATFSVNSNATTVASIRNGFSGWNWANNHYISEYRADNLSGFQLMGSTVQDGAGSVPVATNKITLDFSTVIDDTTLSNVKVYKDGEQMTSGVTTAIMPQDKTRLIATFDNPLDYDSVYKIDCAGLTDTYFAAPTNASVEFKTPVASPSLVQSTPSNNAVDIPVSVGAASMTFTSALDSGTVSKNSVTITPSVLTYGVSLDGATINVNFGSYLKANTQYTITVSDNVLSDDKSLPIEPASRSISFTTAANASLYNEKMASAATGAGNFVTFSNFILGNYSGGGGGQLAYYDTNGKKGSGKGYTLNDNANTGSVVYRLDSGIKSAKATYAENGGNPNLTMTFEISSDGQSWTPVTATSYAGAWLKNDTGGGTNWREYSYEAGGFADGTKYLRASVTTSGNYWNSEIYALSFNYLAKTDSAALLSSIPRNDGAGAVSDKITLVFDDYLYKPDVTADKFTLSNAGGLTVSGAALQSDNKTIILTLSGQTVNDGEYTLTYGGISDLYNNNVSGSVSFTATTRDILAFKGGRIENATAKGKINLLESGYYTLTLVAAVYENSTISSLAVNTITNQYMSDGDNEFDIGTLTDFDGKEIKYFAWSSFNAMMPLYSESD